MRPGNIFNLAVLCLLLGLLSCSKDKEQDSGPDIGVAPATTGQDDSGEELQLGGRAFQIDEADKGLPHVGSTSFKGRGACYSCHSDYVIGYRQTAHDLATSEMDAMFVRGSFRDVSFADEHGSARFFRDNEKYMIRTTLPNGEERDFAVLYCIGGQSLQQYVLDMGDGRSQVLDIGWRIDDRLPGGGEWFRLPAVSPHEASGGSDWTGWNANWNTNCASCHSSELKIQFDNDSKGFDSLIAEEDVSCESCHGGGKMHIGWAEGQKAGLEAEVARKGLIFYLRGDEHSWEIDNRTGNARRSRPREDIREIETCMQCHARRDPYIMDIRHDRDPFHFIDLALLTEGLYHPDGQIADVQVYQTGSFLQSAEYAAGVSCADCHDPHTGRTWENGNDLCLRCHSAEKFDNQQHHFHPGAAAGTRCMDCHMTSHTYLGADKRHDHSFRVPRPDLTKSIGTPNACSECHREMAIDDIVAAWQGWYGSDHPEHFGTVFARAREGDPRSIPALEELAGNHAEPPIVRATALHELGGFAAPSSIEVIRKGLLESESIVKLAATKACAGYGPETRRELLLPHAGDILQSMQIEIGGLLAHLPVEEMDEDTQRNFLSCIDKYVKAQNEKPWLAISHARIGRMFAMRGLAEESAAAFTEMRRHAPLTAQCFLLEADAAEALGEQQRIADILQEGLDVLPGNAELRNRLAADALVRAKPDTARALYEEVLAAEGQNAAAARGLARLLSDDGRHAQAQAVLEQALSGNPYNLGLLQLLQREAGAAGDAQRAAEAGELLAEYYPWV